ncbi:inhibitor of KinA [Anoxybacillus voinovskiensis]|uniref:Inhibitor of KinA n=1 Tax=Anoxybacteroides voinovskiense TaxID=230470 RepID=A0A840E274_9BACL|nr:5-oxoprolinase subunit PxpB [Anoxybacillus voinovskiensis]MBB4075286.1 inhibitor of KinA [Anoxybacillus voinovskiensis]GGJ77816.1 kinase A inhibitor [Anoxybacillus voinovskiensis]
MIFPLSEYALTVRFSDEMNEEVNDNAHQFARWLEKQSIKGIVEVVPTFSSVTIYYDPLVLGTYEQVRNQTKRWLEQMEETIQPKARTIVIPVCYGGEFGPDLPEVARYHGISEEEVVRLHAEARYKVYMIGFAPGFAYLGGLPLELATPRRATPRRVVPAGSVGIAGGQTGIYPLATPGGWQIIGRTPLSLFRPTHRQPSLLCAGDIVRFRPMTEKEYRMWKNDDGSCR